MSNWIEHDGTCCPVPVGTWVEVLRANGEINRRVVDELDHHPGTFIYNGVRMGSGWFHANAQRCLRPLRIIIAYRIPRSRAAEDLIERIRNLEPEKEPA